MWLRRSLAVALAVAFLTGCRGSHSKAYSSPDVSRALRNHGFDVGVQSKPDREFSNLFPGAAPEGVVTVLAEWGLVTPTGVPSNLVLSAVIFRTEDKASCGEPNVIGTCLRKRNVVVLVRNRRAEAAREALDDLG